MPLSENEQRILDEIEQHLLADNPRLARDSERVRRATMPEPSLRIASLGLVLGGAAMVASIRMHYLLAFVCFLLMFACAMRFERFIRELGRSSVEQLNEALRTPGGSGQRPPSADTDESN